MVANEGYPKPLGGDNVSCLGNKAIQTDVEVYLYIILSGTLFKQVLLFSGISFPIFDHVGQ